MWTAISKFFTKPDFNSDTQGGEELVCGGGMDRIDDRKPDMDLQDTYDTRQAKQRASVKWLLSKAFNNKVPENLREPFYRDHENQEHLKPQIVRSLANAELYCLALGNIYSDPNYHNLNHWSILQTLARKGIYVSEPQDAQLTETVLIQTNPLRMSAHMAVIESTMVLYAKEVVTADRVLAAVQRFNFSGSAPVPESSTSLTAPQDHEQGLLLWVSYACSALKKRIEQELEQNAGAEGDRPHAPDLPPVKDLKDLCDGVGLAALISFYCPDELPWNQLLVSYLPTVSESLHNLMLVFNFCERSLPFSVFHMMPEDVTYMRGSMKQNLVVFLADMFNVLEIHPVKCVRYPGMDKHSGDAYPARNSQGVVHKRNLLQSVVTPIPDLRSGLDDPAQAGAFTDSAKEKNNDVTRSPSAHMTVRKTQSLQQSVSEFSEDSLRRGSEDSFIVHRGRAVPTLSSVLQAEEPLQPARLRPAKEKSNHDTKADERGDGRQAVAAGRPSNWEDTRKPTYAGRRSRRNSTSDDSQLTIENFGGSQEHLNFIGRNPDKEVAVHVGRKISAPAGPVENNVAIRSSIQDARGSLQIGYDSDSEKPAVHVTRKISAPTAPAENNVAIRSTIQDARGTFQIGYDSDSEKPAVHVTRKISAPSPPIENNVAIRSSIQDARGTFQIGYDSDSEKQDHEKENCKIKRQHSSDAISLKNILHSKGSSDLINDIVDGDVSSKMASFAELSKQKMIGDQKGIQIVYMQHEKEDNIMPSKSSFLNKKPGNSNSNGEKKTTTFATLPNTTTWQQQSSNIQQQMDNNHSSEDNSPGQNVMTSQLNDIRMKLEEKRRHIEHEKRKMEVIMSKQRQKVGKAAFLQAVTKGKGNLVKTPTDSESSSATGSEPRSPGSEASSKPQRPFTLQEISEDAMSVEHKWLDQDGGAPFVETRKTPDIESMDMEQYQQSIAQMNSSLHDIQSDIQRLASQQNQIAATQQHHMLAEQHAAHMQALAQQHQQHLHHAQYAVQQPPSHSHYNPLQSYGSVPHLPQYRQLSTSPRVAVEQPQFYLHDQPPQPPQRRTWAQQAPAPEPSYQQPELRTWGKPQTPTGGFMLHQNGEHSYCNNHSGYTLSQQHQQQQAASLFPGAGSSTPPPSASPQHRNVSVHRQISQLMNDSESNKTRSSINLSQLNEPPYEKTRSSSVTHAPIPTPPVDDMEPQNISFIGNADDTISQGISKLNITSGTRTYRIPSPTRPSLSRNAFQQQNPPPEVDPLPEVSGLDVSDPANEKGFYISFDNEQPKRPKPPLRVKRMSPKKERSVSAYIENDDYSMPSHMESMRQEQTLQSARERRRQLERELEEEKRRQEEREAERQRQDRLEREREKQMERRDMRESNMRETSQEREAAAAIIIGNDLAHPDPNSVDEMEKKKERIMLLSLQRRQQQEEAKERKEAETQARREREKAKEEERQRKKEEQAARRQAILEQHKLKKAIEEAEREGKVLDKSDLMGTLKPAPKMRSKTTLSRPRPKTIHVDSGSVEMAEGMLQPSQGKKGSTTNLTANSYTPLSSMRRDYYRGSQDSLADRGMGSGILYRDSPDDSRGMSPCRSTNPSLGRRSSYKTSREVQEPGQIRGRPKYPTYQNFKGRKSNSLMNLCGSSSDQDSMAYRYGDTDSGLGRATPPRRAPSPGMGPMRHLPSPSGPGSLPPGLMTKRRIFDDGSSDISSTPSSMMDYNGPRLYKQPATKSNRGIMLNAVEYCVFPGVVNREAKQRVLDEIARSESKHFLILFRDAGCQFRALYSYCPDREEVLKMYGTGPKQVNDRMFDKFFKYNSGGKCFSQIHTKHLTVTIDAFTIHNSLWQGKKVNLPNKKDMALVI